VRILDISVISRLSVLDLRIHPFISFVSFHFSFFLLGLICVIDVTFSSVVLTGSIFTLSIALSYASSGVVMHTLFLTSCIHGRTTLFTLPSPYPAVSRLSKPFSPSSDHQEYIFPHLRLTYTIFAVHVQDPPVGPVYHIVAAIAPLLHAHPSIRSTMSFVLQSKHRLSASR
jgi:hypothetical protein